MSEPILTDAALKERAKGLLNTRQFEKAREVLAGLCRDDQRDVEIWMLYTTANGYLNRYDDVIVACQKVLELEPDSLPALNGYASALAALGRHDEAANRFAHLLRLAPDNPAILNNYGRTMALAGHTREARDALENAVRIQPFYAEARYNLGILLEETGHAARALQEFEKAAELKPGLPDINDRIARLRELAGGPPGNEPPAVGG